MAATTASTSTHNEDDDGTQLTYNETIDALCGFIKTAAHTILCHRQVYPPTVFARRQRYRVPVWASRHPGLNAYVDDVIGAVKVQLQQNLVRSVHVVISSVSSGAILERYRFDVDFILSGVPMRDRDFSIPGNMTSHTMELQLRAFMMKLVSLDGALYDMEDPDDLTWALVLDMKEGCEPQSGEAKGLEPSQGAWVPFDEPQAGGRTSVVGGATSSEAASSGGRPGYLRANPLRSSGASGLDDEYDDAQIVPIKSLDTGVINLMLYVEEHPSAKRRSKRGNASSGGSSTGKAAAPRPRQPKRTTVADEEQEQALQESILAGERDIDQPLPHASSSGAGGRAGGAGKRRKKKTGGGGGGGKDGEEGEGASASDSSGGVDSDSGDSIRSVNDFAGYGKGPGGVGMSGVGM